MRRGRILSAALIVLAAVLAGCGGNRVIDSSMNQSMEAMARARIGAIMARSPQVIEDGQFESNDAATIGGRAGALTAITPLHFWRTITHVERSHEIVFSDPDSSGNPTRATVTVNKVLTGRFNIAVGTTNSEGMPTDSVVHKPLEDHWVRKLLFIRIPHPAGERHDDDRLGRPPGVAMVEGEGDDDDEDWRLVGTSAVEVTSKDAETRISGLRVQATGVDTTLTDPLSLFRLRRVLRFDAGDQVTLTVTTQRNDDEVFLLLRWHRIHFTSNGDNTYTATLQLPSDDEQIVLRHVGVNAFSHGTLFDDQAPYDSQAWVVPFVVKPNMMAEDLH